MAACFTRSELPVRSPRLAVEKNNASRTRAAIGDMFRLALGNPFVISLANTTEFIFILDDDGSRESKGLGWAVGESGNVELVKDERLSSFV